MEDLRTKVETAVKQFSRKLKRGAPGPCLLDALGAGQPALTREGYVQRAVRVAGLTEEEALALEAGFEDWGGTKKKQYPDVWQIGADMYQKYGER